MILYKNYLEQYRKTQYDLSENLQSFVYFRQMSLELFLLFLQRS